jgi:hypothetical protein
VHLFFLAQPTKYIVSPDRIPHNQHEPCHPLGPCILADFKALPPKASKPFRAAYGVQRSWLKYLLRRFAALQWRRRIFLI